MYARSVANRDQILTDCREHRPTKYLADKMNRWAGTREIDFDYVARIVRYEQEDDEQELARIG